jgi:hypothetical protein
VEDEAVLEVLEKVGDGQLALGHDLAHPFLQDLYGRARNGSRAPTVVVAIIRWTLSPGLSSF